MTPEETMTLEERAVMLARSPYVDYFALATAIRVAFRAAVDAETEECAKVIDRSAADSGAVTAAKLVKLAARVRARATTASAPAT